MGEKMITYNEVIKAKNKISEVIKATPFTYAPILSKLTDYEIYLKKENLQRTGSFKIRGAFNKIASISEEDKAKGVVAASAGNHAQGVAFSAMHFNIESTIIMPESTPLTKIMGVEKFGAKVILKGENYDEAYEYAKEMSNKQNSIFIHPFEDEEVIKGQGTIALEMLEIEPDLDAVVVPVGGGGLISGICAVTKKVNPNCKVIGITASGAPSMKNSYEEKTSCESEIVKTIADGIAIKRASKSNLDYIIKNVDMIEEVEEEEIASAILFLLEEQKLLVEGAGSVGVAALLHNKIKLKKGSKVGVVLSGGNIDVSMLSLIIERGLTKSSRKMKLMVTLADKPGSLQELTNVLKKTDVNIVQIGYDRTSINLEFGSANVNVSLETKGKQHQNQIRELLINFGYTFNEEM